MSNKTQLQLNNETLASILSKVLGLPSQESLKHGAYVWKKCEYEENKAIAFQSTAITPKTVLQLSSSDYDLSTKDASFFIGYKTTVNSGSTPYAITVISDTQINLQWGSNSSNTSFTYDPSTATMTWNIDWGNAISGELKPKTQITILDFVDFAVDNDPTAYPDGGEQYGYWYEKVVEGVDLAGLLDCTKVAVDKFTFTSTTYLRDISISHSLGEAPKVAIILSEDIVKTVGDTIMWIGLNLYGSGILYFGCFYDSTSTGKMGRSTDVASKVWSSTAIVPHLANNASPNVEYTLITMA